MHSYSICGRREAARECSRTASLQPSLSQLSALAVLGPFGGSHGVWSPVYVSSQRLGCDVKTVRTLLTYTLYSIPLSV
jgi:hypothetical protein